MLSDSVSSDKSYAKPRDFPLFPFQLFFRISAKPKLEKPHSNIATCGSRSFWSEDDAELMPKILERNKDLYHYLHAMHIAPKKKGVKLRHIDYFYCHVVMDWLARNPNDDYQNDNKRVERVWNELRVFARSYPEAGIEDRGFCNSRWAALRNTWVDCGLVEEIDSKYWFFVEYGRKIRDGKAMQWNLEECVQIDWAGMRGTTHTPIREVPSLYVDNTWRPILQWPENEPVVLEDDVFQVIKPTDYHMMV